MPILRKNNIMQVFERSITNISREHVTGKLKETVCTEWFHMTLFETKITSELNVTHKTVIIWYSDISKYNVMLLTS